MCKDNKNITRGGVGVKVGTFKLVASEKKGTSHLAINKLGESNEISGQTGGKVTSRKGGPGGGKLEK